MTHKRQKQQLQQQQQQNNNKQFAQRDTETRQTTGLATLRLSWAELGLSEHTTTNSCQLANNNTRPNCCVLFIYVCCCCCFSKLLKLCHDTLTINCHEHTLAFFAIDKNNKTDSNRLMERGNIFRLLVFVTYLHWSF